MALAATMAFAPVMFTSAPGMSEPLSSAADTAAIFRIIEIKGNSVKWGRPNMGTGTTVTYAFATAPVGWLEPTT